MSPVLALIAVLGLTTAEAPPAAAPHDHEATLAAEGADDLRPRDCNSLIGEDGYYKVLVSHFDGRGRMRTICTEWTSWNDYHAEHGDECSPSDGHDCAQRSPTARPSCTDQVGEDGYPKVLIEHCKPVGNGGWRCKVQCIDQTSWDLDHAFHPQDSLL